MPLAFQTPLDIVKRACQHLGVRQVGAMSENSVPAAEFSSMYEKIRDRELERNIWRFATKRAVIRPISGSSFILAPVPWVSGSNYPAGSIVAYQPVLSANFPASSTTYYWQIDQTVNGGTTPPDQATYWHRYAGNIVGDVWRSSASTSQFPLTTNGYYPGELVIVPANYNGGTTYNLGDLVASTVDGNYYVSLVGSNLGNEPSADGGVHWQLYTTWITTTGNQYPNFVGGFTVYMSLTTGNTSTPGTGTQWMTQGGSVKNLEVFYPIGAGPAWDTQSMNVLRVPYGFNRVAPSYLFDTSYPYLGADVQPHSDDWTVEGDYIISPLASVVLLRFVSDVIDVYDMNAMFCEGFAAELALNCCERITGSSEKKKDCSAAYEMYMGEARLANAIMEGQPRQPQSEYITCRI